MVMITDVFVFINEQILTLTCIGASGGIVEQGASCDATCARINSLPSHV